MGRIVRDACFILLLTAVLPFTGPSASCRPADGPDAYWCPFLPTLHPGRLPAGFRPLAEAQPVVVRRLRGEHQGVVLAFRSRVGGSPLRISLVGTERLQPVEASVGVVTFVERRSPYVSLVARRQGGGRRVRSWHLADAVVPDETAWHAFAPSWKRDVRYPSLCGAEALTIPLESDSIRYVFLDFDVPETASAGRRTVDIRAEQGGETRRYAMELQVHAERLPMHDKAVCLANDMEDDATLQWLGALGCSVLRTRDLSRRADLEERAAQLRALGFCTVIQHLPPSSKAEVEALPADLAWYFYGRDEPQPKPSQGRKGWDAMTEHVRRSAAIHARGGRVATSLPYVFAEGLAERNSDLYGHLAPYGLGDAHEPLDYANYGAGIHRVGNARRDVGGFHAYVGRLQADVREGRVDARGIPTCKHDRVETFYAPLGMARDPFHARLLFGFYLHRSRLDGAFGWTLYRPRGNPLTDADGADATLAYPADGGVITTYTAEAVRAGVNDLRLVALVASHGRLGAAEAILLPFDALHRGDQPLDEVLGENALAEAHDRLLDLIRETR